MHCIIIDDDERAVRRLEKAISQLTVKLTIDEVLSSIDDAIRYIRDHPCPDLIFLELQFPEGSALGIFKHCAVDCPIILTSAQQIQDLEIPSTLKVIHLHKPVSLVNLENILTGIKLNQANYLKPETTENTKDSIEIKFGQNIYVTKWNEVAYITKQENMSFIIRNDGLKLPVNLSMRKIKSNLPKKRFTLIAQNTFVNVSAIKSISKRNGNKILHLNPEINKELVIDSRYDENFMKWLKENHA